MRVTFTAIYDGLEAINAAAERYVRAQDQVETGKRIRVPSDDPGATLRVVNGHSQLGTIDSYTRASDTAAARVAILDTVLSGVVDKITEAQTAVAGVRGSTATQAGRDAAAARLLSLRDALAGDVNTSFQGTYLFSGADSLTQPFVQVAGVWTYQGNSTAVRLDVGESRSVAITVDGQELLQGSDSTDLLSTLDALVVAAQAGDQTALADGMAALGRAFDRASRAQSHVGADLRGIDEAVHRLSSFKLATTKAVSKDEDADLAKAISDLSQADAAYRAALGAMGTASRVSLLDYLR